MCEEAISENQPEKLTPCYQRVESNKREEFVWVWVWEEVGKSQEFEWKADIQVEEARFGSLALLQGGR